MKSLIRMFCASALGFCLLIMPLTSCVFAEDLDLYFNGGDQKLVLDSGNSVEKEDLFTNFKEVMPGDVLTQTITVTNRSKDSDYISLYLAVESRVLDQETVNKNSSEYEKRAEEFAKFMNTLNLEVKHQNTVVYNKAPHLSQELIKLGDFYPGQTSEITAQLTIPAELGNEFSEYYGEVDWVFVAESKEKMSPTNPGSPGTTPSCPPGQSCKPNINKPITSNTNKPATNNGSSNSSNVVNKTESTKTTVSKSQTETVDSSVHTGLLINRWTWIIAVVLAGFFLLIFWKKAKDAQRS